MANTPWLKQFANPPAKFRTMPLWIWNGQMTRSRITEMLDQFHEQGCGGVFVHPRPGLITEYLSEEWFKLWGFALKECRRLGMECHIYDENSFPTGFAGGHVISQNPHVLVQYMVGTLHRTPPVQVRGELLAAFQLPRGEKTPVRVGRDAFENASPEEPILTLELRRDGCDLWKAGFTYVDLCRPETTQLFLQATHEQYARHFGDRFGKEIKYAFADEPDIEGHGGWPMSRFFLAQFRQDHGYDLLDRLADLCFQTEQTAAVRFDYFWTLNRLFVENFLKPMHDWCGEHKLAFTGHFNEHSWPIPRGHPNTMVALRWMQTPGNDLLGFQFTAQDRNKNALWLLNLTELRSIANQLGRQRVLCETGGGGGYEYSLRDLKSLVDYALANGVNLVDPHLSYQSLAGARKYDWPQTLSDHSSWWPVYRIQADHESRVTTAVCQGRERNRILVMHPNASTWIRYCPPSFRFDPDEPDRCAQWMDSIKQSQTRLIQSMYADQLDFDLGDEWIMAEMASAKRGRMIVGQGTYAVIVLPETMENVLEGTLDLFEQFMRQGGTVLTYADPPAYVRGRPSDAARQLAARFPKNWIRYGSRGDLLRELRSLVPPRLSSADGSPVPAEISFIRKELADNQVLYFIANPWLTDVSLRLRIEGGAITALDTFTGEATTHPSDPTARQQQVADLHLPARGHALWLISPKAQRSGLRLADPTPSVAVAVGPITIERAQDNLLMLDYCDLEVGGRQERGINTLHADGMNWRAQGFDRNLWRVSIQFRKTFLESYVPPDSSFKVTYRFQVADDAIASAGKSMAVAIERPWLYTVRVNGRPLSFEKAPRWWDEDMRKAAIGKLVRAGENTIELSARPFHVLCEIMPVYVLGEFSVRPASPGFIVESPRPLTLGDWREQGIPFYPWSVRYRMPITLDRAASQLRIQVPEWSGSAIRLWLDGKPQGTIACPPYALDLRGKVRAGEHGLVLEVLGNMKNMVGPHFCDGLPGGWSWENCPPHCPDGSKYRFFETGLKLPPLVTATQ